MSGPVSHKKLTILQLCLAADRQKRTIPTPPWPCVLIFIGLGLFSSESACFLLGRNTTYFQSGLALGCPAHSSPFLVPSREPGALIESKSRAESGPSTAFLVLPSFCHLPTGQAVGALVYFQPVQMESRFSSCRTAWSSCPLIRGVLSLGTLERCHPEMPVTARWCGDL